MSQILEILLSFSTLMLISVGVFILSKKIKIPYTVILVFIGLLLVPISKIPFFFYLSSLQLTPELVFYIFLPVLIFESAYNMKLHRISESIYTISFLAVFSLLISALIIGFALFYFLKLIGLEIPLLVTLLFGAMISATDPVAVLALFKQYGVPRRLSLIFENESLFNDGTALALFLIILEMFHKKMNFFDFLGQAFFSFSTMIVGGLLVGLLMGGLFSKMLKFAKNEHLEITVTMIMAHLTFIIAELISENLVLWGHEIKISSIIATVIASIVIGNYGRYKISPQIEEYISKFWEYFAFVANSLVFILLGFILNRIHIIPSLLLWPLAVTIVVVIIARMISIYSVCGVINYLKIEKRIPYSWQKLLSWGSLRGALAVTMILLIPDNLSHPDWHYSYSIKDFITALGVGCIYFTLFIKATTTQVLIKKLRLNELNSLEKIKYQNGKVYIYREVLKKLDDFYHKGYFDSSLYDSLKKEYQDKSNKVIIECDRLIKDDKDLFKQVLLVYAIGIQRYAVKNLYIYNEVNEIVYRKINKKLSKQMQQVEDNIFDLQPFKDVKKFSGYKFFNLFRAEKKRAEKLSEENFMYYRALAIIAQKVTKEIPLLFKDEYLNNNERECVFKDFLARYAEYKKSASEKMLEIMKSDRKLFGLKKGFAAQGILKTETKVLGKILEKEIITPKVKIMLEREFADRAEIK